MSYSRKKHPFLGRTTTRSERYDKRLAHRRERHAVRQRLHIDPLVEILPHRKQFGDQRDFGKDGKWYLPKWAAHAPEYYQLFAKYLRK